VGHARREDCLDQLKAQLHRQWQLALEAIAGADVTDQDGVGQRQHRLLA